MTVKYNSDSIYRNTDIVNNKYLDVMDPVITDISVYDTYDLKIDAKYNNRPDLLAHDLFANAKLWWVFAEFNQDILKDPIIDFKSGITISVPHKF